MPVASSSLLAILLVTQSRSGSSQVVFHYPSDPLSEHDVNDIVDNEVDGEGSSSDSDSDSSGNEDILKSLPRNKTASSQQHRDPGSDGEDDLPDKNKPRQSFHTGPSWEPLLGLGEEALVSLLVPGRAWHKRKLEVGINDLVFVGRPVYVKRSGHWKARKKRKPGKDHPSSATTTADIHHGQASDSATETEDDHLQPSNMKSPSTKQPSPDTKSLLHMFNIVFVLKPPQLEHTLRIRETYEHVLKRFSKILKWEQLHHDYVWSESDLVQGIKSTHLNAASTTGTMYADILQQSSLATAIATIFRAVSTSRIAAVSLSPGVNISLQIPVLTSTSTLPSLIDQPIQPGLWLTTANEPSATDLDNSQVSISNQLAKNFTILLLEPPQKILKDIQSSSAQSPLLAPLNKFLSHARPNKSFYKTSISSQLSLTDVQLLSRHLIFWRRALAIPPLHHLDTYIVSPNAPLSDLSVATRSFASSFPMMPSLPRILSILSQTPVPYGNLIPSSDHKEAYYRVLAWLMRNGWVTQLRTFAYIHITPSTKKAVRELHRAETRGDTTQNHPAPLSSSAATASSSSTHSPHDLSRSPPPIRSGSKASSYVRPSLLSRPSSDTTRGSNANDNRNTPKQDLSHSSLIPSPSRATTEESRWLTQCLNILLDSNELSAAEKEEVAKYWPILVKYFNGSEALETIANREGIKRKVLWELLEKMGLMGGEGSGAGSGGVSTRGEEERRRNGVAAEAGGAVVFRHW